VHNRKAASLVRMHERKDPQDYPRSTPSSSQANQNPSAHSPHQSDLQTLQYNRRITMLEGKIPYFYSAKIEWRQADVLRKKFGGLDKREWPRLCAAQPVPVFDNGTSPVPVSLFPRLHLRRDGRDGRILLSPLSLVPSSLLSFSFPLFRLLSCHQVSSPRPTT
jgi:hypothetical protein